MKIKNEVSVIIPTIACRERSSEIVEAVQSVRASSANPIQIIVVVNGTRADGNVLDWLSRQTDIQVEIVPAPSLPRALQRGRELVRTEYFSTLDDDDVYLPEATDMKLAALLSQESADYLIGNSYRHVDGNDILIYPRLGEVPQAPLESLMEFAWLQSGNALFRSKSIDVSFFNDIHTYAEWTWLAFRLTMAGKNVAVLDEPVFRYMDTENSLSKSTTYFHAYLPLYKRMLACEPPQGIKRMIRQKEGAAHHDASVAALSGCDRINAWKHHWRSLNKPGGSRYLSYTRHLFF